MARVAHTQQERDEFRAHYLYSGIASESADAVGIPHSTGRDWARALADDPAFVADRRALRTRALDDLVAMRMRVARKSLERFEGDDPEPVQSDTGMVFPPDRRPEYGKLVIDAEKSAQHLAKIDTAQNADGTPRPLRIEFVAREDDADDGNDPGVE